MSRNVFLYDGECGFCVGAAAILQRLVADRVDCVPFQKANVAELGLRLEDFTHAAWLVDRRGRSHRGLAGALYALQRSPRFWVRFLGFFAALPGLRHVGGVLYSVVAVNRHRLPFAACESCRRS
ncbi:MAG: DCC1-like thiol-disulfide oxidoreductase family protein [Microbacteriaceae bacterium]|nr:DCC1-like thiol-disulfide oxidoreductase family protein [Microbacteriaceae bacterium]